MTILEEMVRAGDPAASTPRYDDGERARILGEVFADPAPGRHLENVPAETARSYRGRRRWAKLGAAAAVAAGLAVVPVGVQLTRPPEGGGAPGVAVVQAGGSASAAELLSRAAAFVPADPVPAPGQFWKITRRSRDDASESRPAAGAPGGFVTSLWKVTNTTVEYSRVGDPSVAWIVEDQNEKATHVAGPREWGRPTPSRSVHVRASSPEGSRGSWLDPTTEFFAALPTTPASLEKRLYTWDGEGDPFVPDNKDENGHVLSDAHGNAFGKAAIILADSRVSPRLRAAAFDVVRGLPGVDVQDRAADLDGRTGVAVGRVSARGGDYTQLVLDPASGEVLGRRTINGALTAGHGRVAGAVASEEVVSRDLVDALPTELEGLDTAS